MQDTSANNKRIAKNTIFLYFRTFITMIVALYTSRIILNALGVEDFGIWGVLGGIVSLFSFVNSSLSSSIFRYLTYAIGTGDNEQINKTYNASIIVHICLAIVIFILCETIGQWFLAEKLVVPEAKREISYIVFQIVVITSCVSLLSVPLNSVIISYERMNVYAYMSIVDVAIKLTIAYMVSIVPSNKLVWYALMMLVTTLMLLLFYYLYVRIQFRNLYFQRVKDPQLFKSLLGFSGWSLFGNLAYVGYTQGLNMLINVFFGPIVNAARSISLQIEQAVRTFVGNFQTAVNPQIIKHYAQHELCQMHLLIMRGSKFSLYLLFLFALPIMLETDTILFLWLKQVPDHTVTFCRIMFLVIALETISNSVGIGIVATGNIKKLHIIVGSILLTIVPISYFVLKMGAPAESVFIVYLFVEIIAVIARLAIANYQIKLPVTTFFLNVIFKPACVIIFASGIPFLLHTIMQNGLVRFFVVIVVGGLTYSLGIYYFGLDINERNFVYNKIFRRLLGKRFYHTYNF